MVRRISHNRMGGSRIRNSLRTRSRIRRSRSVRARTRTRHRMYTITWLCRSM